MLAVGALVSPEFNAGIQDLMSGNSQSLPPFELIPVSIFSLTMMGINILSVVLCRLLLHNIRFVTIHDIASIKCKPAMLGLAGGILGAISISILTEKVEIPDNMLQLFMAMSHDFWGLLCIVVIGPVAEELMFREAIQGEMLRRKASPLTAITLPALAFSLVHLNLAQALYAFPVGIIFGIIYYKTGNITLTALLHIINNGIVALQLNILGERITELSYTELFGSSLTTYTAMTLLTISSITLLTAFWRHYPTNQHARKKQASTEQNQSQRRLNFLKP